MGREEASMNALVTGGGGFLGGRIARMLSASGHQVTVLGRGHYPELEKEGLRCIPTDIRDAAAVTKALRGSDTVFHVAAKTGIWGKREEFLSVNVEGTRHVIDACRRNGVGRLVYTSTPSVVFGRDDLCGVDESQPCPQKHLCHYAASKAEAERMVLAANGSNLATVALRPHLIWGPGDPHLVPRLIERAKKGKLRQVGNGNNVVDITYIDNAAEAHVQAAERLEPRAACAGRCYFIANGEPVPLWSWINDLLVRLKIPPVRKRISLRSACVLGAIFELVFRIMRIGSDPPMTRFVALQLAKSHYYNIEAARRDLGYAPRVSMAVGMVRLIEWLGGTKTESSQPTSWAPRA